MTKWIFMILFFFPVLLAAQQITVPGTGGLVLTITDKETGEPIANAHIQLIDASGAGVSQAAETDWTGNCRLRNIPAGIYSVNCWAKGYKPRMIRGVKVAVLSTTYISGTTFALSRWTKKERKQGARAIKKISYK